MSSKTIMFYSYKGGAGRTVAAGNIAAGLAKHGKRVLIVDMDFEAPGLHDVFRVENTDKFKTRRGIQDFLRGSIDIETLNTESIINLSSEKGLKRKFDLQENACLLYLIATPRPVVVFSDEANMHPKMEELIEWLNKKYSLDYIILDSASGIRESYVLSIKACNEMMIFFRWSRQHLEGTIRMLKLMIKMREMGQGLWKPFKLVTSAVPTEDDLQSLNDAVLIKGLKGVKNENVKKLKTELGKEGAIFAEIPEMIELKWQESIMVFDRENTSFEAIAKKIIEK